MHSTVFFYLPNDLDFSSARPTPLSKKSDCLAACAVDISRSYVDNDRTVDIEYYFVRLSQVVDGD